MSLHFLICPVTEEAHVSELQLGFRGPGQVLGLLFLPAWPWSGLLAEGLFLWLRGAQDPQGSCSSHFNLSAQGLQVLNCTSEVTVLFLVSPPPGQKSRYEPPLSDPHFRVVLQPCSL